jgi:hypothetical protein
MALEQGHMGQRDAPRAAIWSALLRLARAETTIHLVFCFGHCGMEGNEAADAAATLALALPPVGLPWYVDACRPRWQAVAEADDGDASLVLFPPSQKGPCFEKAVAPKTARIVACLRTGAWNRLHFVEAPAACRRCGAEAALARAGKAVKHLFACPHPRASAQRSALGVPNSALEALWPQANDVVTRSASLTLLVTYAEWFVSEDA